MNASKRSLVPILFACGSVAFLIAATARWVVEGDPVNYTFLTFGIVLFIFAIVFLAVGRKFGGGSRPPNA